MKGKTAAEAKDELEKSGLSAEQVQKILPHKVFVGNRPTNSIMVKKITPFTLGALIGNFLIYQNKNSYINFMLINFFFVFFSHVRAQDLYSRNNLGH